MAKGPVRAKLTEYADHTSCHGLSASIHSRGIAKALWITVFLAALGFCAYQIVMIVIYYLSFPVQYKIELKYGQLDFPAVTICNRNPYMASRVKNNTDLFAVIKYMNGLSAGTIAPPNVATVGRKKRAVDWADNLIVDYIKSQSASSNNFGLSSMASAIAEETRVKFIQETAKFLVENTPKGSDSDQAKINTLSAILLMKANEENSHSSSKCDQPNSCKAHESSNAIDNGDMRVKRQTVLSPCCSTCVLDSASKNCYITTDGSTQYNYQAANTYCAAFTPAPTPSLPKFTSSSDFNNFKALTGTSAQWLAYWSNTSTCWSGCGSWTGQTFPFASWNGGEPSGNSKENCITTGSGKLYDTDCSQNKLASCQCPYCCKPYDQVFPGVVPSYTPSGYISAGTAVTTTGCLAGYTFVPGSGNAAYCNSTGDWSTDVYPFCMPPCSAPWYEGLAVSYSDPTRIIGSTLTWGCNPAYTVTETPFTSTCITSCVPASNCAPIAPSLTTPPASTWDPPLPATPCYKPCLGWPMPTLGYKAVSYNDTPVTAANGTKLYIYNTAATIDCDGNVTKATFTYYNSTFYASTNATINVTWSSLQSVNWSYTLTGSASNVVNCLNGIWSPNVSCTIQCPEYTLVQINDSTSINYTVHDFGQRVPGSQMFIKCRPGYARLMPVTCLDNGTWDVVPSCALMCKPYEIWCTNGTAATLLTATFNYSSNYLISTSYLNVTCFQGYAVPDENIQINCVANADDNGTFWDRCPPPICLRQCPDLNPLAIPTDPAYPTQSKPYAFYDPAGRTPNSTLTWQCGYSYIPAGNPLNVSCYSDSILSTNWTDETIPSCFYLPPAVITMILAANFKTMSPAEVTSLLDVILIYYITSLDPEVMASLGIDLSEMVRYCTYDNVPCDMTNDFEESIDPSLGNCFRYNNKIPAVFKSSQPGPNRGLKMLLSAVQSEYMSKTDRAGFLVIFHTQKDTVFAEDSGFSIAPGQKTNFALTTSRLERLGSPYDVCTDTGESQIFYYKSLYSEEGCWHSCKQYLTIKYCGCGDPRLPIPANTQYCSTRKKNCMDSVAASTQTSQLKGNCSCPAKCHDVSYSVHISMSKYPAVGQQSGVYSCIPGAPRYPCDDDVQTNNSLVQIYYADMSYTVITETPAYPVSI